MNEEPKTIVGWEIPKTSEKQSLSISLKTGDRLFIVGANGSGKSALIQRFVSSHSNMKLRRITAHRQTWFQSGNIHFTPQDPKHELLRVLRLGYAREAPATFKHQQFEMKLKREILEMSEQSRWIDYYPNHTIMSTLFDLVDQENDINSKIAHRVRTGDLDTAKEIAKESPLLFDQINKLLTLGNLKVTIEYSEDETILARHQDSTEPYGIEQMSDGERNAFIIAANVLTVKPETLLLIDEPERHLHRSIIEPFLSALFRQRTDCAFIISTHEIDLPVANPEARVLMVRSCNWKDNQPDAWDVEILEANADLPEDLKRAILGSRKRILFVEGDSSHSLDQPFYSVLFPDISVVPKGGCKEVEKAVKVLRGSQELHHVEAFGLIDRDDRTNNEVKKIEESGVFALEVYSVEALYYCSDAIAAVARRQAEPLVSNADDMIKEAKEKALCALEKDCLAERMAEQRCKRQLHDQIRSEIPDWKSIKTGEPQEICISFTSPYPDELTRFKKLLADKQWDDLVARYPLRESGAFDAIVQALELTGRDNYGKTLLFQIRNDNDLATTLRNRIESLSKALMAQPAP